MMDQAVGSERDSAPASLGPVSTTLVAELSEEARKHGALVWLDKDGTYTELVDTLIALPPGEGGAFPYPLLAYRGSFLELMLALDGHQDGITMQPLVLHMPGFNEEEIARTPAYELYCSGRRHRIALPTLIRNAAEGRVTPAQIETGLETGFTGLQEADNWLDALLRGEATGSGTEISASSPSRLFDDLIQGAGSAECLDEAAMIAATRHYLERTLGLDRAWSTRHEADTPANVGLTRVEIREQLQLDMLSWALCVEFVHDLKREPLDPFLQRLKRLPPGVVDASRALAVHLRTAYPELYAREADRVETELEIECRQASAADLGPVDTFRFEDKTMLRAALDLLTAGHWEQAAAYATDRSEGRSFWVQRDESRRTGWKLIALAARLGAAVSQQQDLLTGMRDLEQAAERYAHGGHQVDRAHRKLEQARTQLLMLRMDEFPLLRQCLNGLRQVYRRWADEQAVAFNALCKRQGFLPETQLQQRTLFDHCVRPLADGTDRIAYLCVDALRFEMGAQLADALAGEARVQLQPRYAELPTLTEVGMNVLAPVCREGRLQPQITPRGIQGFRTGQSLVGSPESRRKAMHEAVGGETCPRLSIDDLLDKDLARIRKTIARARLIVVHSDAIDKAGEEGLGLRHFDEELVRIRAAINRLRDAGVKRFVVTADHGFLLHDDTTRKPLAHSRKVDAKRRHLITSAAADHAGESRVSSTELRYDGDEVQFMFPASTMPFDIGARTKDFVHGGNSLQERLIPVITARYRADKGAAAIRYRVEARVKPDEMGLYRIEAGVVPDEGSQELLFAAPSQIELRLQALDGSGVVVELVDAGGARIEAGVLVAPVEGRFELFFRLAGPRALRTRVELGAALGGDEVAPLVLDRRFAVEVVAEQRDGSSGQAVVADDDGWLAAFTEERVREVFRHIERFGGINEADATGMLGGPRKFRRFSQQFEAYAELAPFSVRIDTSSGQKRYVREGGRNDD